MRYLNEMIKIVVILFFSIGLQAQLNNAVEDTIYVDSSAYYPDIETVFPSLTILTPPTSFVRAQDFHGFIDTSYASVIQFQLFKHAPTPLFIESIGDTFYLENQLTPIYDLPFTTSHGFEGKYFKCQRLVDETMFNLYVVIVGDETQSLFLQAYYPALVEEEIEYGLIQSFQSIDLNRNDDE